ncbi:MAG: hypothetical protein ACE5MI_08790 [Acidimicrobiia bacterium]
MTPRSGAPTPASFRVHRYRRILRAVGIVAVVVALMWAVSAAALLIYTRGTRDATTHELVIPPGTQERIAAGENALALPPTWSFYADDELVLLNQDLVPHRIGPWVVGPNSTLSIILQPRLGGPFLCSLHPAGEIALDIQPRTFNWRLTAAPTLLLGLPLGLLAVAGRRAMRLLDDPRSTESLEDRERSTL